MRTFLNYNPLQRLFKTVSLRICNHVIKFYLHSLVYITRENIYPIETHVSIFFTRKLVSVGCEIFNLVQCIIA